MTPDLSYGDLGIVAPLVLVCIGLSATARLRLGRDIVVSCLRAFVQLTVIGVVLGILFRNAHVLQCSTIAAGAHSTPELTHG